MIKLRSMKWVEHAVHMGEMRNAYKILIGKPKGKRPLRRSGHRWKDNIRMNCRKTGWEGVDCIRLAQDRNW
jgi:hypothetical protein